MKIQNPFQMAEIKVYMDGDISVHFELKRRISADKKECDDSMLLYSLKRLMKAEYVSVYPKSSEEEE